MAGTANPKGVSPLLKLVMVILLLGYEDIVVFLWPPGFFSDPMAMIAIFATDLFIGFDVFIRPLMLKGPKDRYQTWKIYVFFVASPLLLGAPWIEHSLLAGRYQSVLLLRILYGVGLGLLTAGGLLLAWSRLTLGRFGSPKIVIQGGHRLIKTGPYSLLRNPMYTADLLLYCGLGISLGAWISAVLAAAGLLPLLLSRIRLEEKLLKKEFGTEYDVWALKTWRLIPYVW